MLTLWLGRRRISGTISLWPAWLIDSMKVRCSFTALAGGNCGASPAKMWAVANGLGKHWTLLSAARCARPANLTPIFGPLHNNALRLLSRGRTRILLRNWPDCDAPIAAPRLLPA